MDEKSKLISAIDRLVAEGYSVALATKLAIRRFLQEAGLPEEDVPAL